MNRKKVISRRRSRSLAGFASKDLCERIPISDDPSERLMMLLNHSFQYALSVIQKEVMSDEDFDISEYHEKGNECWTKCSNAIVKRNLDKLAVSENGMLSESFRSDNLKDYDKEMALLEEENNKWKEEVSSYRKALEMSMNTPYTVDSSIWRDSDQQYNYSEVLESVSSAHNKLSHQISSLSLTRKISEDCLDADRQICRAVQQQYECHLQQETSHSPKTLIKKLSSARKSIKPYSPRKKLK